MPQKASLLNAKNLLCFHDFQNPSGCFNCQVVIGHTNVPVNEDNILIGCIKIPMAIPIGHARVLIGHTNIPSGHFN